MLPGEYENGQNKIMNILVVKCSTYPCISSVKSPPDLRACLSVHMMEEELKKLEGN